MTTMTSPSKRVYDLEELDEDPDLLELCMIPVMYGGPDPAIRGYDYDPLIHAAPPKEDNPWELAAQLHCTQTMENILNARGDNAFLKERKNVIAFLGAPNCGKLHRHGDGCADRRRGYDTGHKNITCGALDVVSPHRRDGEDVCRVASQYFPNRQAEMRKFKVRRYFDSSKKGRRGSSTSSRNASPAKGTSTAGGGSSGGAQQAGGVVVVAPPPPAEQLYDIEDKFYFQRRDFNRFKEANGGEQGGLKSPPTEGIELHHWQQHEVLLLDTTGMNFFGESQADLEKMHNITKNDPHADPGKDRACRKRRKKKKFDPGSGVGSESGSFSRPSPPSYRWDDSYKNFLPPLLYGIAGILVLCVPFECDYVEFVENTLRAIIAKVRNAPRPALVLVRIRKKKPEDDVRDIAAENAEFERRKQQEQRRLERRLRKQQERVFTESQASGAVKLLELLLHSDSGVSLTGEIFHFLSADQFLGLTGNTTVAGLSIGVGGEDEEQEEEGGGGQPGAGAGTATPTPPSPKVDGAHANAAASSTSINLNGTAEETAVLDGSSLIEPLGETAGTVGAAPTVNAVDGTHLGTSADVANPNEGGHEINSFLQSSTTQQLGEGFGQASAVSETQKSLLSAPTQEIAAELTEDIHVPQLASKVSFEMGGAAGAGASPSPTSQRSGSVREELEEEEEEEDDEVAGSSSARRRRKKLKAPVSMMDEFDDVGGGTKPHASSSSSENFLSESEDEGTSSPRAKIKSKEDESPDSNFLSPSALDELLGEKAELKPLKNEGEAQDFWTRDTPPELQRFALYFHSIRVFTVDGYPNMTFEKSRRFIRQLQVLRKYLFDLQDAMNELKQGPAGRATVQQDAEYKICLPVWHGLSNYHVLYLLKVLVAWSNLKFPLYMALGAAYITAHVPNVTDLRLVNFQAMRAFVADLLSPRTGRPQESIDLRWTAAISAIARYVVKMGSALRDQDYWLLQNELMQWLPDKLLVHTATARHPETGEISTCSQPRALHGGIHRCDRTGCVWAGEYQTPKWTFNPIEQAVELLAAYEAVVRAPEKLSMTEANMPEHERPDKKDEAFFERTANTGGFDLFSDRVSAQFGPPFCALCFKVLMRDEETLRELNRDRNRDALVGTALERKADLVAEQERKAVEREEKKRIAREARAKVQKKGIMGGRLRGAGLLGGKPIQGGNKSDRRSPSPSSSRSPTKEQDQVVASQDQVEQSELPGRGPAARSPSPICEEVSTPRSRGSRRARLLADAGLPQELMFMDPACPPEQLSSYQKALRERVFQRKTQRQGELVAQGFAEAAFPDFKQREIAEALERERREAEELREKQAARREDLKKTTGQRLLRLKNQQRFALGLEMSPEDGGEDEEDGTTSLGRSQSGFYRSKNSPKRNPAGNKIVSTSSSPTRNNVASSTSAAQLPLNSTRPQGKGWTSDSDPAVRLPDIGAACAQHKWFLAKQGNARIEKKNAFPGVQMDAHLGSVFDQAGYEKDCVENNEENERLSPKRYSSRLTQVDQAHSPFRKREYDQRLTTFKTIAIDNTGRFIASSNTYDKEKYKAGEHAKTVAERFAEIARRPPAVRDNRGALVVPRVVDENSLESAIIAGVDTQAIAREQYMRDAQVLSVF
eukprot:g12413.t1